MQQALKIDDSKRLHVDGGIFFPTTINSRKMRCDLPIVVGCIGEASQGSAAAMTMLMIKEFDPALIILAGIGAGMRDKLKIGDIIVPREIADLSVTEATPEGPKCRPLIKNRQFPVKQMMNGFKLDLAALHDRCRENFGEPIIPAGKEADYAKHVNFKAQIADNALASADVLLRDPNAFAALIEKHPSIRAAEMEAGGFVKACETGMRPRLWLVARGISDFGDTFKGDDFHRLASCAVAAWVTMFLEDGLDLPPNESVGVTIMASVPASLTQPAPAGTGFLGQVATELINTQLERLGRTLTEDRKQDLELIRAEWRKGHDEATLSRVRTMRQRDDWRLVAAEVRAKFLRFEASVVLAIERDLTKVRELAREASLLDPDANAEVLNGLIAYHEGGAKKALPLLGAPVTLDGWNLRLALLADANDWPALIAEYDKIAQILTPNAETRRLRAMAFVFSGRLADAYTEIAMATKDEPNWFSVRYAAAIIEYFASLSPAVIPHAPKGWPAPIDTTMVRRDVEALAALRRAEATFASLLESSGIDAATRRGIEGWRLACLANHFERNDEAQKYCAELLRHDPSNPIALAWACARAYKVDLSAGIDALFAEIFPQ